MVNSKKGEILAIVGCMFSGKTDELIRRVHRAQYAGRSIVAFDHSLDEARYQEGMINSHNGLETTTLSVDEPRIIYQQAHERNLDVVAIDEGQFFNYDLVPVVHLLANEHFQVMVAGLNLDFRGEVFGPMGEIVATADYVKGLTAVCTNCGGEATRTQRFIDEEPAPYDADQIHVGGSESYAARCRHCHQVPGAPSLSEEHLQRSGQEHPALAS